MTKTEWDKVEEKLSNPYGSAHLICDGYHLHLVVSQTGMRLQIFFYVNEVHKGIWSSQDCEERRRFHRTIVSKLWTSKFTKGISKKLAKKMGIDVDKTITTYTPFWPSFRPLKAHLIKNNTSIELAPEV